MSTYLIDFENLSNKAIMEMEFKKGDKVYIFYSDRCKNLDLDFIQRAEDEGFTFKARRGENGPKDALDKILISELGFMLCSNPYDEYYIVSQDKGFEPISDYWCSKKYNVFWMKGIKEKANAIVNVETIDTKDVEIDNIEELVKEEELKKETSEAAKKQVAKKTSKKKKKEKTLTQAEEKKVINAMVKKLKEKTIEKRGAHNYLVNIYGQVNGSAIYKKVISELKKAT